MDELQIICRRKLDNLFIKSQTQLNSLMSKVNKYILNLQTVENPELYLHEFPAAYSLLSNTLTLTKRVNRDAHYLQSSNDSVIDGETNNNNESNNNDCCKNLSELTKLSLIRRTIGAVEYNLRSSNRARNEILCSSSYNVQKKRCCCDNQQPLRSGGDATCPLNVTDTAPTKQCPVSDVIGGTAVEPLRINACPDKVATTRREVNTSSTVGEKEEFYITRIRNTTLDVSELHQMLCTQVSSPWDFWLQCYPSVNLKTLRNQIKCMFALGLLDSFCTQPDLGSYVVGVDGDTITRGLVLKATETARPEQTYVKVLDIDTGIVSCFNLENIFRLNDTLSELPAQAVNCELYGLPEKKQFKEYALCEKFVHILRDSVVSIKIEAQQQLSKFGMCKYSVDLYLSNLDSGKSIRIMDYLHNKLSQLEYSITNETSSSSIIQRHSIDRKDVTSLNVSPESKTDLYTSNFLQLPLTETRAESIKPHSNLNLYGELFVSGKFSTNGETDRLFLVSLNVVPCYIVSPGEFFVQIVSEESLGMVNVLKGMTSYFSRNSQRFTTKFAARTVVGDKCCACLYPDEKWYRAKVINWLEDNDESLIVYFVDIGDSQTVNFNKIQLLPERFAKLPIYTHRCHLYGVFPVNNECSNGAFGGWDVAAVNDFINMLQLDVIYKLYGKEFVGESLSAVLYDPSSSLESLNGRLVKEGLARTPYCQSSKQCYSGDLKCECKRRNIFCVESEVKKLTSYGRNTNNDEPDHVIQDNDTGVKGPTISVISSLNVLNIPENIQVEVTHVNAISEFFVVIVSESGKPDTLMELNKTINQHIDLGNMKFLSRMPLVDDFVLACFSEDECWYRARVIQTNVSKSLVKVMFIDYGNAEWVELNSICEISTLYCKLPSQAIKCTAPHFDVQNKSHFEKMTSKFRDLVNESPVLAAKLLSLDELGYIVIDLFDKSGNNIFTEIQRLCH